MLEKLKHKLPVHYSYLMNLEKFDVQELSSKRFIHNVRNQTNLYLCDISYKPISDIDYHINIKNG